MVVVVEDSTTEKTDDAGGDGGITSDTCNTTRYRRRVHQLLRPLRIVFSTTRPVCCDRATDVGGFHKEGVCKECCDHPYLRGTEEIKEAWRETWELEGVNIG